jgi:hypothetical protein
MTGIIVFSPNYKMYEGKSQVTTKPMPQNMTYETDNMVAVLVAAGKVDSRIGGVVEESATPFNIGELFGSCVMTTGLLKMPAPRPNNGAYHDMVDAKEMAIKQKAAGYLEVVEGVHISHSCADPHLTVIVYDATRKAMGQKIHVCVEAEGTSWKFTKVHQ